MAKEGSVAPRERINITYKPATGDAKEQVELPLRLLMLGDFTLREDDRELENREPINIDKDNFNKVMKEQKLKLSIAVDDKLSESAEEGDQMAVDLKFDTVQDFEPESVAQQVPELAKLLELRKALTALKGPLANSKAFRKKIEQLLGDEGQRKKLMDELGIKE
jgi:type VI secretion system protein ImpB